MKKIKNMALVAHDNRKADMVEWVGWNHLLLRKHKLICTGTTGKLVEDALALKRSKGEGAASIDTEVLKLKSGPLGGDQQLGAMIAEGRVDVIIFFWDPMEPQPHDVDVKALLRISVLYNIPAACNRSTADFLISSPLMDEGYQPKTADFSSYTSRMMPDGGGRTAGAGSARQQ
jgi:methylglyoxal synthase